METTESIVMDGITYRVHVVPDSTRRSFVLLEGPNAGDMLSFRHERDLGGTGYSYRLSVEPNLQHPEDYDAFYDAISAPVDSHTITLPYGQTTMTFEAMVDGGEDTLIGSVGGANRYHGLTVYYRYVEPQRVPE